MSTPNMDELIQKFITLGEEDVERTFIKGEVAATIILMGETFKTLSAKVNRSPEHIRVLVRTYEAFPHEEDRRYPEQEFYHYRVAATTDNPHHWMEQAMTNAWSTRELLKAVKGEPIAEEHREAERLLFRIKQTLDDKHNGEWFRDKLLRLLGVQHVLEFENKVCNL